MDRPGASVTFVCEVLNFIESKYGNVDVTQGELNQIITHVGGIEDVIDGAKDRKRKELGTTGREPNGR